MDTRMIDLLNPPRRCGGCTLCCKLLPVHDGVLINGVRMPGSLDKPAGERCPHQSAKGCGVYDNRQGLALDKSSRMPACCRVWSCAWLQGAELRRPDRSRTVVDIAPDYIIMVDRETGARTEIPVVQVWIDPNYPEAHRDPQLRAYLARRGEQGYAALIRFNNVKGIVLFPPAMAADRQWHEVTSNLNRTQEHTPEQKMAVLGSATLGVV